MFQILNGIQCMSHMYNEQLENHRTKENPRLKKEGNYSSQTHRPSWNHARQRSNSKVILFSVSLWKSKNSVLLPQRKLGRKFGYYMCVCSCTIWDMHLKTTEPFRLYVAHARFSVYMSKLTFIIGHSFSTSKRLREQVLFGSKQYKMI